MINFEKLIVSFTQAGGREVAKVCYLLAAEKRKFEVSMESNSVTQPWPYGYQQFLGLTQHIQISEGMPGLP